MESVFDDIETDTECFSHSQCDSKFAYNSSDNESLNEIDDQEDYEKIFNEKKKILICIMEVISN
jgi:hypothetical protein